MVSSDQTDPDDPDFVAQSDGESVSESAESIAEGDSMSNSEESGAENEESGAENADEVRDGEEESDAETKAKKDKKRTEEEEEELIDRFQLDIEESVANWFDELIIGRNVMVEDENEEEDPIVSRDRRIRLGNNEKLAIGRTFFTGLEFKEVVLHYALQKRENLRHNRYEKGKLSFVCGVRKDCPWRVYCSWVERQGVWMVKTVCLKHTCLGNGKCKLMKSPVIGRLFMDKLRMDPKFGPQAIQAHIKEQWNIVSTIGQTQKGRSLGLEWIVEEYRNQFRHIHGYMAELKNSNPGSTVIVDTVSNAAGQVVFDRIYICLGAMKDSFYYCRPLIVIDGTFLKHAVKGCLLTEVAHDPNNQIYPVAWAAVQSENAPNWVWFMENLKRDLDLKDGSNYVVISDRSKGIKHAMSTILPMAEHRHCVKHIVENMKKRHANKDLLKGLVWHLAWSYNKADYQTCLNNIRAYSLALYEDILKEEPQHWCRAFQKIGSYCEDVDNNATESFNATIVKARAKAMIPMLETIRCQCMARITKRKERIEKWNNRISEYAQNILEDEKEDAIRCRVIKGTHGRFEVIVDGNSHVVVLNGNAINPTTPVNGSCSCQKWQLTGIPCEHAYAAIMEMKKSIEDYVCPYFLKITWQEVYIKGPAPVRGPKYWMTNNYVLVAAPKPPSLPGRQKGSKNYNRIKGKLESPKKKKAKVSDDVQKVTRKGRTMHCSVCGSEEHNATTCKKKKEQEEMHEMLLELQKKASEYPSRPQPSVSSSQPPPPSVSSSQPPPPSVSSSQPPPPSISSSQPPPPSVSSSQPLPPETSSSQPPPKRKNVRRSLRNMK